MIWIPALVSHALQFTDRYVENPSFPLHCVVAFTLPFQCFIDCWLFTARERPWQYIAETQRGNWYARYGFGFRQCKGKSADVGAEDGGDSAWRNRKHMSFEARRAYERRDVEKLDASQNWDRNETRLRQEERSWWDVDERCIDEDMEMDIEIEIEEAVEEEEGEGRQSGEADELSRIEKGVPDGGG